MRRLTILFAVLALAVAGCGLKVPLDGSAEFISSLDGSPTGALTAEELEAAGLDGSLGSGGSAAAAGGGGGSIPGTGDGGGVGPAARSGLFSNDTEGLTDKQLTVCAHIPMTGAAPIPRHPDRFGRFYFEYVNKELGGIHGRQIRFITLDDQYYPAGALTAVERCKREGTFLYLGAAGTDQIVAVARSFAAANKVPYLAGPASAVDLAGIPQVKMVGPDYESQHVLLADYLLRNARELTGKDKPVFGMIRINSPFFKNGHDIFKAELEKLGLELRITKVVQKDEQQFADIMAEMSRAGVDVINNFTTPLLWTRSLRQKSPTFNPLFTAVSPAAGYNIIAAALADARANAVLFHHFNPPYDHTDGSLAWAEDIREFRRIFDRYSPERCASNDPLCPDDFDYSAYLAGKSLHRILAAAGPDITRSKLWTMLDGYKENPQEIYPACPLDFTRVQGRGAHYVNVYKLSGSKWEAVSLCIDRP